MTEKTNRAYYKISTLEKGLQVIEALAENKSLSVTQMAKLLGQNRSASHRFLATLEELGYVIKDSQSRYRLSLKLFEIANKIDDVDEIRSIVRPYMRELSNLHGETVNLGRLEGNDIITIDVVLGTQVIKYDSHIGERSPVHTLAMGKAILAFRSEQEQDQYTAEASFTPRTKNTITNKAVFIRELERIRLQGYAMDDEEWTLGLKCISIPILNNPLPSYAISVSGPAQRMIPEKIKHILSDLTRVSNTLANQLKNKLLKKT